MDMIDEKKTVKIILERHETQSRGATSSQQRHLRPSRLNSRAGWVAEPVSRRLRLGGYCSTLSLWESAGPGQVPEVLPASQHDVRRPPPHHPPLQRRRFHHPKRHAHERRGNVGLASLPEEAQGTRRHGGRWSILPHPGLKTVKGGVEFDPLGFCEYYDAKWMRESGESIPELLTFINSHPRA